MPASGCRSSSSTDAEIIGDGSASHEKQNPPVGRYFSRRSVSMWWRRTIAWLRCVAVRHDPNVGWSAGGTRSSITSTSSPWCSRSCSQSSSGHADASTKRSAEPGTDWAPNSLTKRTMRGTRRATLGQFGDLAAVPAEPHVASRCRRAGAGAA